MKTKKFGSHVVAFQGRMNGKPLREYVCCSTEETVRASDPGMVGAWLTPTRAREIAQCLLEAADYVDTHKARRLGRDL